MASDPYLLVQLARAPSANARRGNLDLEEPLPTVAELGEGELTAAVSELTDTYEGWALGGREDQPLVERLDAHFEPLQRAQAASAKERDAEFERIAASNAAASEEIDRAGVEAEAWLWGVTA